MQIGRLYTKEIYVEYPRFKEDVENAIKEWENTLSSKPPFCQESMNLFMEILIEELTSALATIENHE